MAEILTIDDERAVRDVMASYLDGLGHSVTEASSALGALKLLTEKDADLILTDLIMPGLDGLQSLKLAIPHLASRTPVVILTSVCEEVRLERPQSCGRR